MVSASWKRIFISIQMDFKNSHAFNDNTTITLRREVDNFDRRYTQPINAIVISSAIIPEGAEVLCHHNAAHATYELPDYKGLDGGNIASNKRYFSIPETECYAWRVGDMGWNPAPGFEFGLRIFKPYAGGLSGILPTQIKNKLYITSGNFKGKVVMTKAFCDYELIYQKSNGTEGRLIRLRNFPNDPENLRNEIIAVDNETTENVNNGKYLIGLSPTDCKQLKTLQDA